MMSCFHSCSLFLACFVLVNMSIKLIKASTTTNWGEKKKVAVAWLNFDLPQWSSNRRAQEAITRFLCLSTWSVLAGRCLFCYLIRSSVCRWPWSRRLLSVFSRLCSRTFSSSLCLSALREAISLCCLSRCLSASSCARASRLRVCWSSSSRREHCGPHEGAASGATFSFLSCCWITDSSLQIWERKDFSLHVQHAS